MMKQSDTVVISTLNCIWDGWCSRSRGKQQRPVNDIFCKSLLLKLLMVSSGRRLSESQPHTTHTCQESHHSPVFCWQVSDFLWALFVSGVQVAQLQLCWAVLPPPQGTSFSFCPTGGCAARGWFRAVHTVCRLRRIQTFVPPIWPVSHWISLMLSCAVSGFLTFKLKVQR